MLKLMGIARFEIPEYASSDSAVLLETYCCQVSILPQTLVRR